MHILCIFIMFNRLVLYSINDKYPLTFVTNVDSFNWINDMLHFSFTKELFFNAAIISPPARHRMFCRYFLSSSSNVRDRSSQSML